MQLGRRRVSRLDLLLGVVHAGNQGTAGERDDDGEDDNECSGLQESTGVIIDTAGAVTGDTRGRAGVQGGIVVNPTGT